MVYAAEMILATNAVLGDLSHAFDPHGLFNAVGAYETVGDAVEGLHLLVDLPGEQQDPMRAFLDSIPPAIDAAIMAAIRSALERGLHAQISWQPGYDFELRIWDVSKKDHDPSNNDHGLVNVHLVSPHPIEADPLE